MSSCPPKYASKPIRSLKHLGASPRTPEPLWFLYPPWFRLVLFRRYHTEHPPGQDHRKLRQTTRRDNDTTALSRPRTEGHAQQPCTSTSTSHGVRRVSYSPSVAFPKDVGDTPLNIHRTVLKESEVFRKLVPATDWIRRPSEVPRQEVLERRAHFIRHVNPDIVCSLLSSISSTPGETQLRSNVSHLKLTSEEREELLPAFVKQNTWLHGDGSWCVVKLDERHLELHGSTRAREIALHYFTDRRHYARSKEHRDWYGRSKHGSYHAVGDIGLPPVWSVRSVIDYVSRLTRPRSRRSAMRYIHQDTDSHNQAVFKALEDVFNNPASQPFLSTRALTQALSYCRQHTEFPTTATRLWDAFSATKLRPDIHCFNQELGRCLVGKEFIRFYQKIGEMKELAIEPDSTTWAIAMTYTNRQSSRAGILRLAERLWSLGSGEHQNMIVATANQAIKVHIGTQNGMKHFMEHMKAQFGPDWLSAPVLRQLLRAFRLQHAKVNLTSELLSVLQTEGQIRLLDSHCVLELLRISRKAGNLEDALELVKLESLTPSAELPQPAISLLFSMAWQEKCFNICRLFWFVGATSGRITFDMQKLVQESLQANVSKYEDPVEARWQILAGKIVIGTNLNADGFTKIFPNLSKSRSQSTPVEWLLNWTPDGDLRNEQVQLGQLLVERDLHAYRFFETFSRPQFLSLLDEAVELDKHWKEVNGSTNISSPDLLTRAIRIPLKKRIVPVKPDDGVLGQARSRQWYVANKHQLDYGTLQYQEHENTELKTSSISQDSLKQCSARTPAGDDTQFTEQTGTTASGESVGLSSIQTRSTQKLDTVSAKEAELLAGQGYG